MMNECKHSRSALLALLLLCLAVVTLALPRSADAAGIGNARVIDEMNILSDAEAQKLDASLAAVERTHHIRILAAVVGEWKDKPLPPLAANIIKTIAPGGENGAILLLSPENRSYYVATDAKMQTRITDEGIEHLTEKFLPDFESKNFAAMFTAFGATTDEMLTYYEKEGRPYTGTGALSAVARAVASGGSQAKSGASLGAVRVVDESDLLSDAEEQALDAKLAAYEQAHRIRILIGTVKNTHGEVLGKVANAVVDRISDDGANGTIVLLLAPRQRDFYISTENKMRERITDGDGIDYLAEQFIPALKENKYGEGFTAFAAAVDEMVTYYEKEGKPYNPNGFMLTVATLVAALIAAAITYFITLDELSTSMRTVMKAYEADDYLERGSFRLTHKDDVFLRTTKSYQKKHKEETSSSSSSSSSSSNITTSSRDESHGGGGGKY